MRRRHFESMWNAQTPVPLNVNTHPQTRIGINVKHANTSSSQCENISKNGVDQGEAQRH